MQESRRNGHGSTPVPGTTLNSAGIDRQSPGSSPDFFTSPAVASGNSNREPDPLDDDLGNETLLALLADQDHEPIPDEDFEEIDVKDSARFTDTLNEGHEKSVVNETKSCKQNATSCNNSLSSQELLEMANWGLPELVRQRYRKKGIERMFKWQAECLSSGNVLDGGNLVYSAPTSAGKTLVAEILLIKRVLETKKKGILILPFVSLAREKMFMLQDLLRDIHVRVFGFMGSVAPPGGIKRADIAVCTIEKANSIINRMLEEGKIQELGAVVVDELHMLGDPSRGYLLELLLTKIRYMSMKKQDCDIQIIGMSATLPNLDLLASWLDADLYKTDFRPVPLKENVKIGNKIYNHNFELAREISPPLQLNGDSDDLIYLCLETILNGHSVLVFCPTKNWCEQVAKAVASEFCRIGRGGPGIPVDLTRQIRQQLDGNKLAEVLEQLKRSPAGLDTALGRAISFGTAYHHAGLTFDERDIVEGSFKLGILRVIVATSTLSSGVNLPARRVIVRCPFTFKNQLIDTLSYKQMIGRAGRKGIDTEGESILFCRENERNKVQELVQSALKPVASCLILGDGETIGSAMKRAILEVISSGAANTPEEVEKYASCTMLAASLEVSSQATENSILNCVKFLEDNEFIRLQEITVEGSSSTRYIATQLGQACLASSLSPDEGLQVFVELQKARKSFVLENELHLVYQVVPIYAAVSWPNLDWMHFFNLWDALPNDMKRVGDLVGVEERFLVRAMRGTISTSVPRQAKALMIHQRFYTALALHDLVNEVPIRVVSEKYGTTKGMLQSLQQTVSTFAGMVTAFCHKLGWLNLELLIGQFQDRLQFGIQRELIDLCRLTTLNGQRARVLFSANIESVAMLANSKEADIENILQNATPFETAKKGENESENEANRRKDMKTFWVTGQKGLTINEAAKAIVEEARDLLQKDLGVKIDWNSTNGESLVNEIIMASGDNNKKRRKTKKMKDTKKNRSTSKNWTKNTSKSLRRHYAKKPSPVQAKNLVLNSMKRPSPNSIPENSLVKSAKLAQKHAGSPVRNVQSSTPASKVDAPLSGGKSFDMSGQMEDIFENETDEAVNRKKQHESLPSKNKVIAESASPYLTQSHDFMDEDLFDESFLANLSAIEKVAPREKRTLLNKEADNSCPETPNMPVCRSETIKLAVSDGRKSGRCPFANDSSLSESSLEKDISTHMYENSPSNREYEFAKPSPPVGKETPKSGKSRKLAQRRQVLRKKKSKISPGVLILSDSDSDCLKDSPLALKNQSSESLIEEDERVQVPGELRIIEVCSDRESFESFRQAWKQKKFFSLSLACQKTGDEAAQMCGIGARIKKKSDTKKHENYQSDLAISNVGITVVGLAVSWSSFDCNFIDLRRQNSSSSGNEVISLEDKINLITEMLHEEKEAKSIAIFDAKSHIKLMYLSLGVLPSYRHKIIDPKIAVWMLQPTDKERSLASIIVNFDQASVCLLGALKCSSRHCGSLALNPAIGSSNPRQKAVLESVAVRRVMEVLEKNLKKDGLWKPFIEIEMRSVLTLARMELNGVGFSSVESERQRKILLARMKELEEKAYEIVGHSFSLTSTNEISKILYQELKLPINGDPSLSRRSGVRNIQSRVRGARTNLSTAKDVLIKLKAYHDLPGVILEWRKLNMSVTKVVIPMQKAKASNDLVHMERIYPNCHMHTATGRVTLHEPNIQSIPKDFDVPLNEQLIEKALGRREAKLFNSQNEDSASSLFISHLSTFLKDNPDGFNKTYLVSMRHAIVPSEGFMILAADYSQLELRILAHLSDDEKLKRVLNDGQDVFKSIAAQWKKTSIEGVTDEDRHQAKQICYGMIYGIGTKSLGEQLDIVEEDAAVFLSDFRSAYPGIKKFMDETLVKCKKTGYVETMTGRRRYLPKITESSNQYDRAAAERQAINTTIQGSAADLVKTAMNDIERRILQSFPDCRRPLRRSLQDLDRKLAPKGAYFLLQMHDELIYEVAIEDVLHVAKMVKMVMENSCQLRVRTPIKIRVGPSWGQLQDFKDI